MGNWTSVTTTSITTTPPPPGEPAAVAGAEVETTAAATAVTTTVREEKCKSSLTMTAQSQQEENSSKKLAGDNDYRKKKRKRGRLRKYPRKPVSSTDPDGDVEAVPKRKRSCPRRIIDGDVEEEPKWKRGRLKGSKGRLMLEGTTPFFAPVTGPRRRVSPERFASSCEDSDPRKSDEDLWVDSFRQLEEYRIKHGNCDVTGKTDAKLHRWVITQRRAFANIELRPDRKRMLDGLGFRWATSSSRGRPKLSERGDHLDASSEESHSTLEWRLPPGKGNFIVKTSTCANNEVVVDDVKPSCTVPIRIGDIIWQLNGVKISRLQQFVDGMEISASQYDRALTVKRKDRGRHAASDEEQEGRPRSTYKNYTGEDLRMCIFQYLSGEKNSVRARQLEGGKGNIPRSTFSLHANKVARQLMPLPTATLAATESPASSKNVTAEDLRREMQKHPNYKTTNLDKAILKRKLDEMVFINKKSP